MQLCVTRMLSCSVPKFGGVYAEWQDGILLSQSTRLRQWPLRDLERRFKLEKKQHFMQWRQGDKTRGDIGERLSIIMPFCAVCQTHQVGRSCSAEC